MSKILIIDDEVQIRTLLTRMMELDWLPLASCLNLILTGSFNLTSCFFFAIIMFLFCYRYKYSDLFCYFNEYR